LPETERITPRGECNSELAPDNAYVSHAGIVAGKASRCNENVTSDQPVGNVIQLPSIGARSGALIRRLECLEGIYAGLEEEMRECPPCRAARGLGGGGCADHWNLATSIDTAIDLVDERLVHHLARYF
jgi:hypothetical protein